MKCGQYKIEIPGCTDLLFCKNIEFVEDQNSLGLPGYQHASTGQVIFTYYAADDLGWLHDWYNYCYHSSLARGIPLYDASTVAKAYFKRKIKIMSPYVICTLYDTFPTEIGLEYTNFSNSTDPMLPCYVRAAIRYDWIEKTYI